MKISRRLWAKMQSMKDKDDTLVVIQLRTKDNGIKDWSKYRADILEQIKDTIEAIRKLGIENIEIVHINSSAKLYATKEQIERIKLLNGVVCIDVVRLLDVGA